MDRGSGIEDQKGDAMNDRHHDWRAKRRLWLLMLAALVVAVAVVAAGCGGEDEAAAPPAEPAEPAPAEPAEPAESAEPPAEPAGEGDPIKIGILSDCEGAFGAWFEHDIGGAQLPLIARGATPAGANPSDGLENAVIAGRPIEIVGYGCGDETPEKAIEETRRLVEQEGAEILIGPLSGDEGIAVANYSLEHPETTFINGTSGAQDTTLKVRSPNFFRFNSDGAQWSAGLADYAYNVLGWREAVTIADDYSFAYTSAAGFIAEFCAIGGNVTKRIWPALGETDYTSFASQISPDDNVFTAVGGAGVIPFLKAYEDVVGPIQANKFVGNLFYGDPLLVPEFGGRLEGIATSDSTWGDSQDPKAQEYFAFVTDTYPDIGPAAASVFVYNYYNAAEAMAQALEETGGVLEDDGQASFREALAAVVLDAPFGQVSLDENRQGIQDNFVKVVTGDAVTTFWKIPETTQDFGGTFTPDTPAPDRDNPTCETRDLPWVGNAEIVGEFPAAAADNLGLSPEARAAVGIE
jgi:branched-chain amino acid transport system substrate-binding protein